MKTLKIFLVLALAASSAYADKGDVQRARFQGPLQDLGRLFPPGRQDVKAVGERALTAGARGGTFNLQGLTRIYKKLDKEFEDIGETAKGLEDGIGEVDKWNKILASAMRVRTTPADLTRIRQNLADARAAYMQLLVDAKWVRPDGGKTFVQKAQEKIANFDWPKGKEDRAFVLDRVDEQIKKVRDTKFDMRILEHGDGLHELRRQLRWILIEAQSTAGLIAFKPGTACPAPQFTGDIERRIAAIDQNAARFLEMPPATTLTTPCLVSRCLVVGTVFMVTQLGSIKDQVEQLLGRTGTSDTVPPQFLPSAVQNQMFLIQSNLLQLLHDEIKQCEP